MQNLSTQPETKPVSLLSLARQLHCSRQLVQNWAIRLGIQPTLRRDPRRQNHHVTSITPAEAETIAQAIAGPDAASRHTMQAALMQVGHYYLVQLEPEHDPGRFKLGFTTNLKARLRQHQTSAPFATYLGTWPARRSWERAATDSIARTCTHVHFEVFRSPDIHHALTAAQAFFALMPTLTESLPTELTTEPPTGDESTSAH